ncbi:hypothetical protein ABLN67_07120, partial [Mycobacterium tuberculosis]
CTSFGYLEVVFNRFIYRREWSFRIYRETLSRFSCAAGLLSNDVIGGARDRVDRRQPTQSG